MTTSGNLLPTPRAGNPGSRPNKKGGKILAEEIAKVTRKQKEIVNPHGKKRFFLPAGSHNHANHSVKKENVKVKRTTATYGRKCLGLYESSAQHGLSLKMSVAYLLLSKEWFSSKCALTWKPKVMKSKRLLFQLAPSMPPTEEIGYGLLLTPTRINAIERSDGALMRRKEKRVRSGRKTTSPGNLQKQIQNYMQTGSLTDMLPTPTTGDRRSKNSKQQGINNVIDGLLPTPSAQTAGEKIMMDCKTKDGASAQIGERAYNPKTGKHVQITLNRAMALLPTPAVQCATGGARLPQQGIKTGFYRVSKVGKKHGAQLHDVVMLLSEKNKLIETPTSSSYKGAGKNDTVRNRLDYTVEKTTDGMRTGLKLHPHFALWMMGFPINWLDFPMEEKSVMASGERKL